jgi:HEAT repeat protein
MGICAVAFSAYDEGFNSVEQISEYATYLKEAAKSHRKSDNILLTPEDLEILPVPIKEFVLDDNIPLFKKRTVIEAMGESGYIHYGRLLIELLQNDIHSLMKKSILYALGRLRFAQAEEVILEFASDSNPHLRTRAVEALGQIGGSKYLEKIGDMVEDSNPYVAVMAVKSIGSIGHPAGLKYLKDINPEASRWLKIEAAVTRCFLGDRSGIDELFRLLKDPNPVFREKIARTLEHIPQKDTAAVLIHAIETEKVLSIKNTFIKSFGRILQKLSYEDLSDIKSEIWKIYKSAPSDIQPYLLPAIGKTRIRGAKKILEKKLSSKSSLERYLAIEGIVNYNNREHIYMIRKSLKDVSTQVRARSAQAISEIQDLDGMEFLRQSLKDRDDLVRRRASESILRMISDSLNKEIN